jgi:hypothetical protein
MDVIRLTDKFVNVFVDMLFSRLFLQKIIGTQIAIVLENMFPAMGMNN